VRDLLWWAGQQGNKLADISQPPQMPKGVLVAAVRALRLQSKEMGVQIHRSSF